MAIQSKGHHTEDIIYRFGPPKEMKLTPAYMTPLDMIMPLTYNRHIYFYRNPDPTAVFMPTRALAAGLEKALSYYPVLYSGFITKPDRLREFTTIGYPIPLYERQVNYGFERFEPDWRHDSIPAELDVLSVRADIDEASMLAARITRFRNNEGVAITIAIHHVASDGFGVEIFMDTWTACVRGDTPLLPCNERSLVSPTGMPTEKHPEYYWVKPEFASFKYAFTPSQSAANAVGEMASPPMKTAIFQVSAEKLAELKAEAMKPFEHKWGMESVSNIKWISSGDALAALIWRATSRASSLAKRKPFSFHVAANCRAKFDPPLPCNYFGNASFRVNPVATVQNLRRRPLGYWAKVIRKRLVEMNGQRLQSAVNWLAMLPEQRRLQTPTQVMVGIDFAIANLAFPRLYDVNFGYGRPIRRRLPYDNWCGGAVVFGLPPTNADEASGVAGVEFYIGMLEKDFTKLLKDEEFCQFTKYIG